MKRKCLFIIITLLSVLSVGCSSKGVGNVGKEAKEVEISADNWNEYFEILSEPVLDEETNITTMNTSLVLKEEFADRNVADSEKEVDFEYNYDVIPYRTGQWSFSMSEDATYEPTQDCLGDVQPFDTLVEEVRNAKGKVGSYKMDIYSGGGRDDDYAVNYVLCVENFEVLNVQGNIELYEE